MARKYIKKILHWQEFSLTFRHKFGHYDRFFLEEKDVNARV